MVLLRILENFGEDGGPDQDRKTIFLFFLQFFEGRDQNDDESGNKK